MGELLPGINREEALRYMGYRGGDLPEELQTALSESEREVLEAAEPRYRYALFELERGSNLSLRGTRLLLPGESIRKLLEGCDACILMAATLGGAVDTLLRRAQATDMRKAVLLDGCASAAIETVCDNLETRFRAEWSEKEKHLTGRFSPGYGDLPVLWQQELCRALDTERKIGLSAGPSGMLLPQKSVTAVLGVGTAVQKRQTRGCQTCALFDSCSFRKEGKTCGNLAPE
ncbi:hypothetical protein [Papillibacter cinnamivorans]|uniref:Vitamin B12 dependent methionine synthase, activation domain n=1 Tax=Papillibacter cinnamivorans DSM 12816 TaxID=1122930 RepID=A0A1W1Z075_9FIRM|nr:hypothetical protein [Papillibacter cinnamivorans]SMC41358.1 Vitamin B12 dependent methionine synthase, activation domain [Papillibacter cinnamivorans DSM 12816]